MPEIRLKPLLQGSHVIWVMSSGKVRNCLVLTIEALFDGKVYDVTVIEEGYIHSWMLWKEDQGTTWKVI